MVVPAAAIRKSGGRDYVLVVANGTVERRAVSSGGKRGDGVLLTTGLAAGESVVVSGPPELAEGARVQEKNE